MYDELKQKLALHLVKNGFTYSVEDNEPATLREVKADDLISSLLGYLVIQGYTLQRVDSHEVQ